MTKEELELKVISLEKEIERLKSWDHFKNTVSVMQDFANLDKSGQQAIELMMDGLKYREKQRLNL